MPRRKAIKLDPDEVKALKMLYLIRGIPDGQYARRPDDLRDFTDEWNAKQRRTDTPEELLHYIATQRKQKKWVTFDGNHQKLAAVSQEFLGDAGWQALIDVYVEIGQASDNFTYDVELKKELVAKFFERTGKHIWGNLLAAAIIDLRKDGRLPRLKDEFGDIEEIV